MSDKALPFVSIIVPSFNHQAYVGRALASVISQDYEDLEIIVVDDGSTDKTASVAEKVLSRSGRATRLVRQENQGAHAALNRGVGLARGDYVGILNSDDLYDTSRISTLVATTVRHGAHLVFSMVRYVGERGEPLADSSPAVTSYTDSVRMVQKFPTPSFELLRHNLAVTSGNLFFSKSLWEEVGGFADYKTCHDWDFLLKSLIHDEPVFLPEVLMSYRLHGTNTIQRANRETRASEAEKVIRNYLAVSEEADNDLAPCQRNWGAYWHYFVRTYMQHHPFMTERGPRVASGAGPAPGGGFWSKPGSDEDDLSLAKDNETGTEEERRMRARNELLEELIVRLEEATAPLERNREALTERVHYLEELLTISKVPPLPAGVFFYFGFRKLLFPLYSLLGADGNRWLRKAKAWLRNLVGL